MVELTLNIAGLLAGKAVPFGDGKTSAIAKRPLSGTVRITALGVVGDEQADLVNHGGPDKAVHLYAQEHYPYWQSVIGDHPLLSAPGAFGENLATTGGMEQDICLGDQFAFGTCVLEVSHGRQPCWKIDQHFGRKGITARIVTNGRCGIYFRVIRVGVAEAGEAMTLIERPLSQWPIARIFALLIGGGAKRDMAAVKALADMSILAEAWRSRAQMLASAHGA
ncbi:MAG: MOSC domain-containing protein [Sphingobium sp.]